MGSCPPLAASTDELREEGQREDMMRRDFEGKSSEQKMETIKERETKSSVSECIRPI